MDALCDSNSVDLVMSVCVFHEAFSEAVQATDAKRLSWSIDDTPAWPDTSDNSLLRSLRRALSPSGRLVAANRWGSPEETLQWVRFAEIAGFEVELATSYMLTVRDRLNGEEHLPITVHRLSDQPTPCLADDVLALHTYESFANPRLHAYEGTLAEVMRRALGACSRLAGFDIDYNDGSGIERMELLVCGALVGIYRSSSRGYRSLQVGSLAFVTQLARELNSVVAEKQHVGRIVVLEGSAGEPRWRLYGFGTPDA